MSSTSSNHRGPTLPDAPGRRMAAWSLLMVAGTAAATVVAWIAGTLLQSVVFDLDEQQLLTVVGGWGYVAGLVLLALMAAPALVGIVLGVRARHLGEPRLGTTGVLVNASIAIYLVTTAITNLLLN